MTSLKGEQKALKEVNDRIASIERRLRNAKAARVNSLRFLGNSSSETSYLQDSYVGYLRGKYPTWTPSLPTFNPPPVSFSL